MQTKKDVKIKKIVLVDAQGKSDATARLQTRGTIDLNDFVSVVNSSIFKNFITKQIDIVNEAIKKAKNNTDANSIKQCKIHSQLKNDGYLNPDELITLSHLFYENKSSLNNNQRNFLKINFINPAIKMTVDYYHNIANIS